MSTAMLVPLVAGNRALTIGLFLAVVAVTLYITFWASRQSKTAADYYAGGRSFSGFQNGLAVSGDYMSAASFLGISGAIALYGYDGFLYSIGFLVAWLVALLLIAELLRNSGRYTMADQLAYRMRQTPVRSAAAISTIVVSIFYLLAQMVGAGALVGLLLGVTSPAVKNLVIVSVGVLMIIYVTFGGMKGTTWVQIVKAVLLMVGTILITFLVLVQFGFQPFIARQAHAVIDLPLLLAPRQEFFAGKARVGAHDDFHFRQTHPHRRHDLFEGFHHALAGIPITGAQLRPQTDFATKAEQRQVAVLVVVRAEEAALLLAVQRVMGRIEIEHHHLRVRRQAPHA